MCGVSIANLQLTITINMKHLNVVKAFIGRHTHPDLGLMAGFVSEMLTREYIYL